MSAAGSLRIMNIDKILVPTDFSEASDEALRYAVDLAAKLGHKVIVLHAFGPPIYPVLDGAIIPSATHVTELIEDAGKKLEALCARFDRAGVAMESRAVQGSGAESIVRYAADEKCNLIVMGTHGRTGWKRAALGSVAEQVVRTATVPVLTVRTAPEAKKSLFDAPPVF